MRNNNLEIIYKNKWWIDSSAFILLQSSRSTQLQRGKLMLAPVCRDSSPWFAVFIFLGPWQGRIPIQSIRVGQSYRLRDKQKTDWRRTRKRLVVVSFLMACKHWTKPTREEKIHLELQIQFKVYYQGKSKQELQNLLFIYCSLTFSDQTIHFIPKSYSKNHGGYGVLAG